MIEAASLRKQSLALFKQAIYVRARMNDEQDHQDNGTNTHVSQFKNLGKDVLDQLIAHLDLNQGGQFDRVSQVDLAFWGPLTGFTVVAEDVATNRWGQATVLDVLSEFIARPENEKRFLTHSYFDPTLVIITCYSTTYYPDESTYFNITHDPYVICADVRKKCIRIINDARVTRQNPQ
ncbi:MAG: hypothetical protein WCG55_02995 [bacterium]